jgi:hypothetical protein
LPTLPDAAPSASDLLMTCFFRLLSGYIVAGENSGAI